MPYSQDVPNFPIDVPKFTSALDQYLNVQVQKIYASCQAMDKKKNIPLPQIYKYPFIDPLIRQEIICSQYKYLTIITDGAINPTPNLTRLDAYTDRLIIEFDDGHIWKIEHSLWNLNIERYSVLYFSNLINEMMLAPHPQNGYGNISLILSVDEFPKYDVHIQPPHFCISGLILPEEQIEWWAGKYNFRTDYQLLIPYIPYGYNTLRLQISMSQGDFTYWVRQYCCDDLGFCETSAYEALTILCVDIPLFSDRIYFSILNNNIAETSSYCMQGTWIRKGKF